MSPVQSAGVVLGVVFVITLIAVVLWKLAEWATGSRLRIFLGMVATFFLTTFVGMAVWLLMVVVASRLNRRRERQEQDAARIASLNRMDGTEVGEW